MVEASVMEPEARVARQHHDDIDTRSEHHERKTSSTAQKALVAIWNFTLKKLMEFSSDDVIEDRIGCKRVLNIATSIGDMVVGDENVNMDDVHAALVDEQPTPIHTNGNGNGYHAPKSKSTKHKHTPKPAATRTSGDIIKLPDNLSPQEQKFCEFLRTNREKGYIPEKTICKALGINHLGSLVTKVRHKGVPVASAHTDRRNGEKIAESVSGFKLAMN